MQAGDEIIYSILGKAVRQVNTKGFKLSQINPISLQGFGI